MVCRLVALALLLSLVRDGHAGGRQRNPARGNGRPPSSRAPALTVMSPPSSSALLRERTPVRNAVFLEGGIVRGDLSYIQTDRLGRAMQKVLRAHELAKIASLAVTRQTQDNQISRALPKESADEIVLNDHIGPMRLFPERARAGLYRAMRRGLVPTARRGQIGGSWAVSAEQLVYYAVQSHITMDPATVVRWYQRAVGRELASDDALELLMAEFDEPPTNTPADAGIPAGVAAR